MSNIPPRRSSHRSGGELHSTPGVERQALLVFAAAAALLFVYEATKTALLPQMTLWESHTVTIVFGSVVAYLASRHALRVQAALHARVLHEAAERTRAEAEETAARESESRFRELVEQSPEAIVLHRDGRIVYANPAAERLVGARGPDDLAGRALGDWIHPDDRATALARGAALAQGERDGLPVEYRLLALDGGTRVVEAGSVQVSLAGGTAVQTVLRDVTERKRLERELVHQAFHDALTGLANRALFRDRVSHALAAAARGEVSTAVLFLDLDDFKTVNDSLGHAVGDELLGAVARRLLAATRGCDTVARLGGDEFAILLEGVNAAGDAAVVAERVVEALSGPVAVAGTQVTIGASLGIAVAAAADDVESVLRNADLALYAAKARGKRRCVSFEPSMYAAARERLELEADLGPALERGEFHLAYQPIVELATGRQTGVEALARWRHPTRGAIAPSAFIPVAEEIGFIVPLGRWVLAEACRQVVAWEREHPAHHLTVSVNVSGRQLQDPGLLDDVRRALDASGLAPRRLVLEITESVMMRDAEQTLERLRALKALGVRLAIDDFGTGYSSLGYLRQFPVDILKIDKSFIDGVGHGGDESVIANAIVTLGESLSLSTVAEGIEDEAQLARLTALGCRRGQGYLFARPLTPEAMGDHLASESAHALARRAGAPGGERA